MICFLSRGKDQAAKDIAGRYPISHYWDSHDPKLVVCEAHILPRVENKDEKVKPRASLTKAIEEGPVSICLFNLYIPYTKTDTLANSEGPDEMAHNEPSRQDLHCLPFCS